MRISQAKQLIKNIAGKGVRVPTMLVGSMGVGKSAIVRQAAEELGIQLIDLRLAQQEPGDLIGIPYVKDGVTAWAKPEWWPAEGTRGILFLDELNRAPVDVRQAVFQLVLEWRMHTHILPKGWYIVAAINPDNGNYQVETLDIAMLRRFCVIKVSADVDTWLEWALGPGQIDRSITGFINANRKLLHGVDDDIKLDIKYNPDGYRMLNDLREAKVIPAEIEVETFAGLLGTEVAVAFRRWIDSKFDRPVSGLEVIDTYTKVSAKVKKQKNDENYTTVTEVLTELGQIRKLTAAQLKNTVAFFKDIAPEFQATFASKIPQQHMSQFAILPEFTEAISKILQDTHSPQKTN